MGHLGYGSALFEISTTNYFKPALFSNISELAVGQPLCYLNNDKVYSLPAIVQQLSNQHFLSMDTERYFSFYINEIKNYLSESDYETSHIWWDELRERLICLVFTGNKSNSAANQEERWIQGRELQLELKQGFGAFSPHQVRIYGQYQIHEPAMLESLFFSGLLDKKNNLPIIHQLNQLRQILPELLEPV
ncbi:hypothetical protein [Piscirickettsia litoralis]|uniref:Uncharacterized protein n=1 Tax=Piscirickettsia litoralis TaxID=1891921 RepID=A0ABX3A0A0_9GAMM|nr:hypothetical protein [Piscirickettsia litoralis]ODN42208.1 hypothetical protein BGC07_03735 [Piscirickettsia litoralis]